MNLIIQQDSLIGLNIQNGNLTNKQTLTLLDKLLEFELFTYLQSLSLGGNRIAEKDDKLSESII